jgi:hypothetical protein
MGVDDPELIDGDSPELEQAAFVGHRQGLGPTVDIEFSIQGVALGSDCGLRDELPGRDLGHRSTG